MKGGGGASKFEKTFGGGEGKFKSDKNFRSQKSFQPATTSSWPVTSLPLASTCMQASFSVLRRWQAGQSLSLLLQWNILCLSEKTDGLAFLERVPDRLALRPRSQTGHTRNEVTMDELSHAEKVGRAQPSAQPNPRNPTLTTQPSQPPPTLPALPTLACCRLVCISHRHRCGGRSLCLRSGLG